MYNTGNGVSPTLKSVVSGSKSFNSVLPVINENVTSSPGENALSIITLPNPDSKLGGKALPCESIKYVKLVLVASFINGYKSLIELKYPK